jgi:hypothetical protein
VPEGCRYEIVAELFPPEIKLQFFRLAGCLMELEHAATTPARKLPTIWRRLEVQVAFAPPVETAKIIGP